MGKIKRIILADDDEDECKFFEEAASQIEACIITCVPDGVHLMQTLTEESISGTLPDFIFLDLNMPLKDGIDCLREIKDQAALNKIPIIVYSITASQKTLDEIYPLGASLFMRKPDHLDTLRENIEHIIRTSPEELASLSKAEFM